ncbi:M23 family metallopeptidase [Clostridium tarantellae]|uniref:Peptidoglycan DD-metalloendopeptidase family protein n=1 Tax=Clostridium tarantellae TaxID=39493 RepID=A0A6I1MG93_9CLOT|nr:M23 family metallopeptidase [Clostridium tarantellae]MPQ42546.1 peptidoglycan DD-metalloendopeptidase family protein [Clostridium tarantellae]
MDKKQRFKNFIKKEGFYVILFVCICVVATVAAFTAKNDVKQPESSIAEKDETYVESDNSKFEFENAELVEEENEEKENEEKETSTKPEDKVEPNKSKDEGKKEESKKQDNSIQTSANVKVEYVSPVKDGKVTRSYNLQPRIENEGKTASVYKGVDIEAAVGTEVKAIADGKVLEARQGDSKEGFFVKLEHSNGVVSMYANLDKDLKVKVGDNVNQGLVLGNVGSTVKTNPQDRVSSEYLLFHVEKSNEPIDPQQLLGNLVVKND